MTRANDYDVAIVGGGFYGCCLALFLRSVTPRVVVIEQGEGLLERASRVNQARVHSGYHYPRSFRTALRSRLLQAQFVRDFAEAVVSDFDMLYAIASERSKVTSSRFARMFASVDTPVATAPSRLRALFDARTIDEVFLCKEFAFDWSILRDRLRARLDALGVPILSSTSVRSMRFDEASAVLSLSTGEAVTAGSVFNVTYANLNHVIAGAGADRLAMKHELAEVALVEPPPELERFAVTVMDGPFFSCMPYPSEKAYSLTHVRYTPHFSWTEDRDSPSPYETAATLPRESRWRFMVEDSKRFMPCLADVRYRTSLFDVKTVLTKNERDDGRPILLHRHADAPRLISVMGAKIDNIYDLFEALPQLDGRWADAHAGHLLS